MTYRRSEPLYNRSLVLRPERREAGQDSPAVTQCNGTLSILSYGTTHDPGFEAMLWLRKGFDFAGAWTVREQNQLLAFCFGLPEANKA